jgi:hypothetical protein
MIPMGPKNTGTFLNPAVFYPKSPGGVNKNVGLIGN